MISSYLWIGPLAPKEANMVRSTFDLGLILYIIYSPWKIVVSRFKQSFTNSLPLARQNVPITSTDTNCMPCSWLNFGASQSLIGWKEIIRILSFGWQKTYIIQFWIKFWQTVCWYENNQEWQEIFVKSSRTTVHHLGQSKLIMLPIELSLNYNLPCLTSLWAPLASCHFEV